MADQAASLTRVAPVTGASNSAVRFRDGVVFYVLAGVLAIFFNLVISVIGALSVFSVAYIGTQGGPAYATYFYVYHLYISAFQFNLMGYASAMAWVFLLIVLALTWFQFWAQKRWVFYAGDEREAGGKDG